MLHRPPSRRRIPPSADERRQRDCERQRRKRAHDKAGEVRFEVYAPEDQIAEAMINSQRLTEAEALDHALVEEALASVVSEWAARWRTAK